jgi:hypothetical protein
LHDSNLFRSHIAPRYGFSAAGDDGSSRRVKLKLLTDWTSYTCWRYVIIRDYRGVYT